VVSVVVVSYNTPRTLEQCLASLSRQPAAEILVMDCSDTDPGVSLGARFPAVQFRHFDGRLSIPQLRREGIHAAKGEIVALTESWMEPCAGWVESLIEAHREYADVPAVGGPIAFPCAGAAASRLEWADYFSEYGEHIPGAAGGREVSTTERISGANCSYKRWAIEECRDLVDQAAWEPLIHERLLKRGHELKRAAGARVCYERPARLAELLRRRFRHGRGHGAERSRGQSGIERIARGGAAPLVPWVMLGRLRRGLPRTPGLRRRFWEATGWILALNAAWALGEAAGTWFGTGKQTQAIL
jgi:glycosyltransferase involved in cell wall biosynthesis